MNIHYENPKGIYVFDKLFNGGNGYGTLCINNKEYKLINCGCEYGKN
jgi:hypothetical protein